MIKAIYLFYLFKFAPRTIDNRTCGFWRNAVNILNDQRKKSGGKFYFWKVGRLYCREPYAIPMGDWTSSKYHPFCWKKYNAKLTRAREDAEQNSDASGRRVE